MIKTVKRWPYVLFGIIVELLALLILLMLNLAPKTPIISGGMVVLYLVVFSIANFIVIYVMYHERLIRYPYREELKGISVLTDDQARDELLRRANRLFTTRFVIDPEYSEGRSMRVGTENTDVYALLAKEDILPSDLYIILAVSKEDPSRWNFKTFTGMIDEKAVSNEMRMLSETLASKPERKYTQTIERRHPLTGEVMAIETITRPESIRRFAQEQLEPREELV